MTETPSRPTARIHRGKLALALLPAVIAIAAGIFTATRNPPPCIEPRFDYTDRRFDAPPCLFVDDSGRTIYTAQVSTSLGPIVIRLAPEIAPDSVNNFIFLARNGFFDGTTFHRVEVTEDHAFVQAGDPGGTGRGNPGYTYGGETPSPITRYIRGVVAMANLGDPSSNGSQFFIVVRDYEELGSPFQLPVNTFFGIVRDPQSLATLDAMVTVPLDGTRPIEDIRIHAVTVREEASQEEPIPIPSFSIQVGE